MNFFKVTDNAGNVTVYRLPEVDGSTVSIGRSQQCHIALVEDTCLSRTHCEVRYWGGLLYVRDCHSSNGTHLDGEPITQEVMLPGRVFTMGQCSICLAEDWEEAFAVPLLEQAGAVPPPPPPMEGAVPPPPPSEEPAPVPPPPPVEGEPAPEEEPQPEPEPEPVPPPPPVEEEPAPEEEPQPEPEPVPPPPPVEEEPAPEEEPQPEPEPEPVPPPPPAEEEPAPEEEPETVEEVAPLPGHKLVKVRRTKRKNIVPVPQKGGKKAKALVRPKEILAQPGAVAALPVDFPCSLILHTTSTELWEGDCLQFTFEAAVDCHLYLIQWDAEGGLSVLVGSKGADKDTLVHACAERPFPPLKDSWYDFVVEAPFGEDIIMAVACTSACGFDAVLREQLAKPETLDSPVAAVLSAIYACNTGEEMWSSAFLRLTTHEGMRPGK